MTTERSWGSRWKLTCGLSAARRLTQSIRLRRTLIWTIWAIYLKRRVNYCLRIQTCGDISDTKTYMLRGCVKTWSKLANRRPFHTTILHGTSFYSVKTMMRLRLCRRSNYKRKKDYMGLRSLILCFSSCNGLRRRVLRLQRLAV